MALTDAWLKAKHRKVRDDNDAVVKSDRDGLSVRLSPKGKLTWQLRYRYAGKAKRLDIGTYPTLSLKEARKEAERLKGKLEKGSDPKVVLKTEKQAVVNSPSVQTLFNLWYEKSCVNSKDSHASIKRSFEVHVIPKIGALPAAQVTLQMWLNLLEELAKTTPAMAARILTNARQMLKWCVKREKLKQNVLADIKAADDLSITKNIGTRSLSQEEIFQVWEAIDRSRMATKNKIFLKLCLVFGCRNGELRKSLKREFDLKKMIWTVPPENHKRGSKTGKALIRPIIPELVPLIEQAKLLSDGPYMICNSDRDDMMSSSATLSLPYNLMQWLRRNRNIQMQHWTVHDLRKTARTNWATLTEPHVAEIMLGHKLPGEWEVYDHHHYLEEQSSAYSKWWSRLMEVTRCQA